MALGDNIGVISVLPYDVGSKPRKPAGLDCVNALSLTTPGTPENIPVPAAASIVRLVATADIYVKFTGAAATPGDVTDGTASELIPLGRENWYYIKGVANISVVSGATTPIVTASFYL